MAAALKILVVEDFDVLREATVRMFAAHGHLAAGADCAEALDEELAGRHFDIFVIDLNLPGEDGLSLAQRVRAAHPLAGIVMVTARTTAIDAVSGYSVGADTYLPKPVEPDVLLAAVEALGRRLHAAAAPPVEAAALVLDEGARQLRGTRDEVSLTTDEVRLLTSLARATRHQLENWQLMAALGLDPETYSKSALEVRLLRLRRKLVQVGAEPVCLRAVRGAGYALNVPLRIV